MPRSIVHLDDLKGVALRLRQRREELGMSQRQLAFPGCTAAYISRLEAAARVPSRQMLDALAERLLTTRQWIETGDDSVYLSLSRSAVDEAIGRQFSDGDESAITWESLDAEERRWMFEGMQCAAVAKAGAMAAAIHASRQAKAEALARVEAEMASDLDRRLQDAVQEQVTC